MPERHQKGVLLAGVVGSQAYGLATPESDTDRLGVYTVPTEQFFGLNPPVGKDGSRVFTNPDVTYHEALKMCRLLSSANPTVTELLWLPNELYEVKTFLGQHLVDIRSHFLSAKRVRDAYFSYATQQFDRLWRRGDASFSSDLRKRTSKHARHLLRLLHQGHNLYATGELVVQLRTPELYREFGEQVAEDPEHARKRLALYEDLFDQAHSPLPEYPNFEVIEDWLIKVRRAYLQES